jgi:hypothetical protein
VKKDWTAFKKSRNIMYKVHQEHMFRDLKEIMYGLSPDIEPVEKLT